MTLAAMLTMAPRIANTLPRVTLVAMPSIAPRVAALAGVAPVALLKLAPEVAEALLRRRSPRLCRS